MSFFEYLKEYEKKLTKVNKVDDKLKGGKSSGGFKSPNGLGSKGINDKSVGQKPTGISQKVSNPAKVKAVIANTTKTNMVGQKPKSPNVINKSPNAVGSMGINDKSSGRKPEKTNSVKYSNPEVLIKNTVKTNMKDNITERAIQICDGLLDDNLYVAPREIDMNKFTGKTEQLQNLKEQMTDHASSLL